MLPPEIQERYLRSGAWSGETIPTRAARICAEHANRVALIDGQERTTFAQAAARIAALSAGLASRGAGPGTVVAWLLPNAARAAIVHHAIMATGATASPWLHAWGAREITAARAAASPSLVIADPRDDQANALGSSIGIDEVEAMIAEDDDPPAIELDPGADAIILFTSGTTGRPKGVVLSHRAILSEVDSFSEIHGMRHYDRYLCGPPVGHIAGLAYGIHAPFALGSSAVFIGRWDAGRALHAIEHDRASLMTGPPTFIQSLADHPDARGADLSNFRLFSTGGASIQTATLRRAADTLGCTVKRAYGSTEVPTLTAGRLTDDEELRLTSDGRVIGEGEMRLVADGSDVGPEVEGEIWARAPEMFTRYLDPADNADAFADDGWFRTGDLGMVDADGNLRVTGRLKDVIIRGGENISALELEDLIASHPAVKAVAVVGLPDDRLGEKVCACVVLHDGASITLDDVTTHLRAAGLATHKLPERLEIMDGFPISESGKVRKAELAAMLTA